METKLRISLFSLRITIFLVMFMWTIDKFIRPEHATAVFEKFYYLSSVAHGLMYLLAVIELVVIVAFVLGLYKRFSYGIVLILHAVSTFSAFKQYLSPYVGTHLLFFAAWPMLAACLTLYLLQQQDTLFTIKSKGMNRGDE